MDFITAVKVCFRKFADFSGYASRREYWFFFLFTFVTSILADALDTTFFINSPGSLTGFGPLSQIQLIVTFIPGIAVGARRLHDTNRSGWRQLWLITIIGIFFLFYWYAQKSTRNEHTE